MKPSNRLGETLTLGRDQAIVLMLLYTKGCSVWTSWPVGDVVHVEVGRCLVRGG